MLKQQIEYSHYRDYKLIAEDFRNLGISNTKYYRLYENMFDCIIMYIFESEESYNLYKMVGRFKFGNNLYGKWNE